MDAPYLTIPPLFKKLEEISLQQNTKKKQALIKDLNKILENDFNSIYEIYADLSAYSFATLLNLETLRALHSAYTKNKKYDKNHSNSINPFEIPSPTNGKRAIHYSVEDTRAQLKLEYLISTVGVNVNAVDKNGNTALHIACRLKKKQVAQFLLFSGGVNVNAINNQLQTPLWLCVVYNNVDMASILLKRGASTKITTRISGVFDIHEKVLKIGSTEMKQLFKTHQKRKKNRHASIKKAEAYSDLMARLKKDFMFVCSELEKIENIHHVMHLADKLKIQYDNKASKKEICGLISQKVLLKHKLKH